MDFASQHDSSHFARQANSGQPGERPLLLLSVNSAWNVLNFRMNLVRAFQREGYAIAVAAPAGDEAKAIEREGMLFVPLPMAASGTSPFEDAALFGRYCWLMRSLRPAAFLGFTAKPNVYGSLAARFCGVPAINNITGLGTAFIGGRGLERLLSLLYRLGLRRSEAVFFHNPDDRDLFVERKLVSPARASVLPGSGVDLDWFRPVPLPESSGPTFLFVGRLLWEKGAGEFAEAARLVKQEHAGARFVMVGSLAQDGRGVPSDQIEQWQRNGAIDYVGPCTDIRPHLAAADCVVLPSYREGLPRVLLEAAAMGRPAIASDAPGCRHAVIEGVTGYLSRVGSAASLADAAAKFIGLSKAEREQMGLRARAHAEEHFGDERVSAAYLSVLHRAGLSSRHT